MRRGERVSCSTVGFLQQENWLASLPLHLSSAYLQGSTAHTDYGNTANTLKKRVPLMPQLRRQIPVQVKERKEILSLFPSLFSFLDPHSPASGLAHSTLLQVLSGFFQKAPWDSNQTTESDINLGNLMLMKCSQQFCDITWIHIAVNSFSPLDPGSSDKPHFQLELFRGVAGNNILRSLAWGRSLTFFKAKAKWVCRE